jgi:hypothetical protein
MTTLLLFCNTRPSSFLFVNRLNSSSLKLTRQFAASSYILNQNDNTKKYNYFCTYGSVLTIKNKPSIFINHPLIRWSSTESQAGSVETKSSGGKATDQQPPKKMSKFKQLYTQYGPLFIVIHLTTVVMWIYGFFLLSKQCSYFILNLVLFN